LIRELTAIDWGHGAERETNDTMDFRRPLPESTIEIPAITRLLK
jgi:hypothetical protein